MMMIPKMKKTHKNGLKNEDDPKKKDKPQFFPSPVLPNLFSQTTIQTKLNTFDLRVVLEIFSCWPQLLKMINIPLDTRILSILHYLYIVLPGVSDAYMRMLIRHNLRYPDKPLTSVVKLEECGEDYQQYFYITLATTILLLLVLFLASALFYSKIRSVLFSSGVKLRFHQRRLISCLQANVVFH